MSTATVQRVTDDRNGSDFAPPARTAAGFMDVATTRAAQEVQAAMVIAKRYPRDENAAWQKIMRACKRKTLAEQSLYAYPRGDQTVTGPSIRLAEALAQSWGNLDFGIIELEQKGGESQMMAYCWDLETNCRQTKVFAVKHIRHTRRGQTALEDPRDIYEMTANQGARRLRACILGVIPGDVVDAACAECEKTMAGNNERPLADRLRDLVTAFGEMGVTQEMIEKRLGHKVEVTIEAELVGLRKIFVSIRDNAADRSNFFDLGTGAPKSSAIVDTLEPGAPVTNPFQAPPAPVHPIPGVDPNEHLKEWPAFLALINKEAEGKHYDAEAWDKGLSLWLLSKGAKGKPDKTTTKDRAALLAAIRLGTFDLATGSIKE